MRNLLIASLIAGLSVSCVTAPPSGPGVVTITETTTSTTTTTTTTSTIPLPTVARFVFSPVTPEVLQVVNFDASGSTPGSGRTIVKYHWDWGDGDVPKTGVKTTHDFVKVGVYLVTLTVTDSAGTEVKDAQTITVRPVVP
jgi:PKD repeat protein